MKRSVSLGSPDAFDSSDALANCEMEISRIMYSCGLDPNEIENTTIDEIVDAVKATYCGKTNPSTPISTNMFVARHRWQMLVSLRWNWFARKAILAVIENE